MKARKVTAEMRFGSTEPGNPVGLKEIVSTVTLRDDFEGRRGFGFRPLAKLRELAPCGFCGEAYDPAATVIMLDSKDICPACVMAGPERVAELSERIAADDQAIKARWEDFEGEMSVEDVQGFGEDYRRTAVKCASIVGFRDLDGGRVAIAIAGDKIRPATCSPASGEWLQTLESEAERLDILRTVLRVPWSEARRIRAIQAIRGAGMVTPEEAFGFIGYLVDEIAIERAAHDPEPETREAWETGRGQLIAEVLREFGEGEMAELLERDPEAYKTRTRQPLGLGGAWKEA